LNVDERSEIATATKNKAYNILTAKGFTSYGIAAVVSSICESIVLDQRQVHPLSHWQEDLQCCLSLPAVLGRAGIVATITPPLNEEERASMEESAKKLRQVTNEWSPHGLRPSPE
jgi:L-lactate dehydrogenase